MIYLRQRSVSFSDKATSMLLKKSSKSNLSKLKSEFNILTKLHKNDLLHNIFLVLPIYGFFVFKLLPTFFVTVYTRQNYN